MISGQKIKTIFFLWFLLIVFSWQFLNANDNNQYLDRSKRKNIGCGVWISHAFIQSLRAKNQAWQKTQWYQDFCSLKKAYPQNIDGFTLRGNTVYVAVNGIATVEKKYFPYAYLAYSSDYLNIFQERSYKAKMNHAYVRDMQYPKYRPGPLKTRPRTDPGRFRNDGFLRFIYGDNSSQVLRNSVIVRIASADTIFNARNGAAKALRRVSLDLEKLFNRKPEYKKYFSARSVRKDIFYQNRKQVFRDYRGWTSTYMWRYIQGTKRLSSHSFAIALDLNPKYTSYWQRNKGKLTNIQILSPPQEIVDIFEKHRFIWGGKWYHYDTLHFEYRPELFY